jgi:hypothetical protein
MIDYSIPNFSLIIGDLDCSDLLDSIALRLPNHEPGQILTWKGDFKISLNLAAIRAGLDHDDLDPRESPSRWRSGQQPVKLAIYGQDFPVLRIENYRYDRNTRQGEGRLVQVLDLLSGDRPDIPTSGATAPPRKIPPATCGYVVDALIQWAISDATLPVVAAGVSGVAGITMIDTVSRSPIGDAQRLAGISWQWLTVDEGEIIYNVPGDPGQGPIAFTRNDQDVEIIPNLDAIQFAAPRVIVSGSTYADDPQPCAEPAAEEPNADGQGRPTKQKTTTLKPFSEVFDTGGSYNSTPTTAEEKTILYAYQDRRFLDEVLPSELQPDYNAVIGQSYELQPNEPLFTATIKRQPFGFLFPDAGTDTTLVIGEAIVETPIARVTFKPSGVLSGNDQSLTLIAANRETLTTNFIPAVPTSSPIEDPNNPGNHTCFEKQPTKEPPQVAPTRPLKEIPIVGSAELAYAGWQPIINTPLIINFGFLPDGGVANLLAYQIARQQERRRDSWLVRMPIPMEWAAINFRPLSRCNIGGRSLQIDGPIITISDGVASLEFEGGAIDNSSYSISPVIAPIILSATISSVLVDVAQNFGAIALSAQIDGLTGVFSGIGAAIALSAEIDYFDLIPTLVDGPIVLSATINSANVNPYSLEGVIALGAEINALAALLLTVPITVRSYNYLIVPVPIGVGIVGNLGLSVPITTSIVLLN